MLRGEPIPDSGARQLHRPARIARFAEARFAVGAGLVARYFSSSSARAELPTPSLRSPLRVASGMVSGTRTNGLHENDTRPGGQTADARARACEAVNFLQRRPGARVSRWHAGGFRPNRNTSPLPSATPAGEARSCDSGALELLSAYLATLYHHDAGCQGSFCQSNSIVISVPAPNVPSPAGIIAKASAASIEVST